jgi:hypothetical protein
MEINRREVCDAKGEGALLEALLMEELLKLHSDIVEQLQARKLSVDEATSILEDINSELRRRTESASKYTVAL